MSLKILVLLIIMLLLSSEFLTGCATPYQPRYRQLGDYTRDWNRHDEFKLRQQFKSDQRRWRSTSRRDPTKR